MRKYLTSAAAIALLGAASMAHAQAVGEAADPSDPTTDITGSTTTGTDTNGMGPETTAGSSTGTNAGDPTSTTAPSGQTSQTEEPLTNSGVHGPHDETDEEDTTTSAGTAIGSGMNTDIGGGALDGADTSTESTLTGTGSAVSEPVVE